VRAAWREEASKLDPRLFVSVDEASTSIAMTRRRARSKRGTRVPGKVPRNHGKPTSLVAALSLEGLGAEMTLEGAFDSIAFVYFVERFLAPSLEPGQIVVLDNLSVHKAPRVRELIEARGCRLLFLRRIARTSRRSSCASRRSRRHLGRLGRGRRGLVLPLRLPRSLKLDENRSN